MTKTGKRGRSFLSQVVSNVICRKRVSWDSKYRCSLLTEPLEERELLAVSGFSTVFDDMEGVCLSNGCSTPEKRGFK